jgi:hypothetical protein
MPKIEEILHYEEEKSQGEVILFLEGKFWKAYEKSAYVLTKLYGFKPTKRYVKLVGQEIISVGFPQETLLKYVGNQHAEFSEKITRVWFNQEQDEQAFTQWKIATRIKENKVLPIQKEEKRKPSPVDDIGLPVFRVVYDLQLRLFQYCSKMSKDYRYTLGEDIKKKLLRMQVCIYHANAEKQDKLPYITEALGLLVEVKLCVRILHDSKQLSLKRFALLCEQMVEVENQLIKWKQYNLKQ